MGLAAGGYFWYRNLTTQIAKGNLCNPNLITLITSRKPSYLNLITLSN